MKHAMGAWIPPAMRVHRGDPPWAEREHIVPEAYLRRLVVERMPHLSPAGDPPPVPVGFMPGGDPLPPLNIGRKEPQ